MRQNGQPQCGKENMPYITSLRQLNSKAFCYTRSILHKSNTLSRNLCCVMISGHMVLLAPRFLNCEREMANHNCNCTCEGFILQLQLRLPQLSLQSTQRQLRSGSTSPEGLISNCDRILKATSQIKSMSSFRTHNHDCCCSIQELKQFIMLILSLIWL